MSEGEEGKLLNSSAKAIKHGGSAPSGVEGIKGEEVSPLSKQMDV